jgi:hypothetical protein
MALVVDTCRAAATVESEGFKPGPMGNRGLGQLAYDKGLRVLAASAADVDALEDKTLQQGVLTYSLVHEGLNLGRADFSPRDRKIALHEWFKYAVYRVPVLLEELDRKRGVTPPNGQIPSEQSFARMDLGLKQQRPSLFEFKSKVHEVIVSDER